MSFDIQFVQALINWSPAPSCYTSAVHVTHSSWKVFHCHYQVWNKKWSGENDRRFCPMFLTVHFSQNTAHYKWPSILTVDYRHGPSTFIQMTVWFDSWPSSLISFDHSLWSLLKLFWDDKVDGHWSKWTVIGRSKVIKDCQRKWRVIKFILDCLNGDNERSS